MAGTHTHALFVHGDSELHRLPASPKLGALGLFVLAVVLTPREAIGAFGVHAGLVLVGAWGRVALHPELLDIAIAGTSGQAIELGLLGGGEQQRRQHRPVNGLGLLGEAGGGRQHGKHDSDEKRA